MKYLKAPKGQIVKSRAQYWSLVLPLPLFTTQSFLVMAVPCRSLREGTAAVQRPAHRQEEDSDQEENVEPDLQRVLHVRPAASLL